MFQRNSILLCTFVRAGVAQRSGLHWVQLSGRLKRLTAGRVSILPWETGNKPANPITGLIGAKLDGPPSGRQTKLLQAAEERKNVGEPTSMRLIANAVGSCDAFCVGSKAC